MTKRTNTTASLALATLALASIASAEIKLNENISTNGYVVGSYQLWSKATEPANAGSSLGAYKTDSFDVDVAKLQFDLNYKPVSGVISLHYRPNNRVDVLDAYVNYDAGRGFTVSGGKFLSWLGYEAFDPVNMHQISYANNDFLNAIPNYHSGVRVEYAEQNFGAGVAVVDSIYNYNSWGFKGDGEFRYNRGLEAYVTYKGIKDITLWAGVGYESQRTTDANLPTNFNAASIVTLDFWASYQMDASTLVAAEFVHKNGDARGARGYNWLFMTQRKFSEKFATTFRVSGEHVDSYAIGATSFVKRPNFLKYTVSPSYDFTANLSVRGEVSYYNYANYSYRDKNAPSTIRNLNSSTYVAIQALFKF